MKPPKLKPCPFCGEEPTFFDRITWFKIACDNEVCPVTCWTAWFDNKKKTTAAWNRRAK
jgi:hypothetical protein